LLTGAQLNSERFQTRYLIPGVLAAGQPGGIFGSFKSLKTSLAADLMISLASGTPFLGRFPVPEPGKVLFLSGESGLPALRSIARRICAERGLSLESLDNFRLSPELPRLDQAADVQALRQLIEAEKPVCVVIDPAHLAMGGDHSHNLFAMGQLLRPLAELCESTGCAVLLVHHCKRSSKAGDPATLDDVAWSGFAEFSAQWLLLARRRPFDAGTGQHELWLTAGSREGHHGLWEVDVDEGTVDQPDGRIWKTATRPVASAETRIDDHFVAASEERRLRRRAAAFGQQRQRVLEVLDAYPDGSNATAIRDRLGINGERMKRILDALVDEGAASKTEEQVDRRRWKVTYQRIPHPMDLSAAAVEARRAGPPDEKVYNIRSGHFVERKKVRATVLVGVAPQESGTSKMQGFPQGEAPLPPSRDFVGKDLGANRSDSTPATPGATGAEVPQRSGPVTGPDTFSNSPQVTARTPLSVPTVPPPSRQAAPQQIPTRTAPGAGATPLLVGGVQCIRDGRIERVPPPKFR
jgi:hypothetical protein